MLTVVMVGLLAQAQGPVKLAVPGLSLVGVEAALGEAYVERFATLLGRSPALKVTTRGDIAQLLGMERQKQLLGCEDGGGSSCLAELVGGLGMDAVLSGSIAKTGSGYLVTMRVIRAGDGSEVASTSERLKDEDRLNEWLEAEAPRMARRIEVAFGRTGSRGHVERWVPGLVGAGLLLAGAGMEVGARIDSGSVSAGVVPLAETSSVVARGRALETGGWILVGVGAAGIAASVTWALLAGADAPQVAVVPVNGGAVVALSGVLP